MTLLKTKNYKKSIKALSKSDQVILSRQEKILGNDIFDPKLHTKKLKGLIDDKIFSFRITISYRGIFRIREKDIILFAIGHRKDIYKSVDN